MGINVYEGLDESFRYDLGHYRYKVFVEKLGWPMINAEQLEFDQFDNDDTVYINAIDDQDQEIVGCARLLPTTCSYLLADVFPELAGSYPLPKDSFTWELSRFSAHFAEGKVQDNGLRETTTDLLDAAIGYVKNRNGKQIVTVSPLAVEKMLINAGYKAKRLAAPIIIDNQAVIACLVML